MSGHATFDHNQAHRLDDTSRLETQVSGEDLTRLFALHGAEDLLDLGSGTGFYTDRMAGLTTGTIYAVELQHEMNDHYRRRGLPANVRLVPGDITNMANLPLEPASVDVACSIAVWHEIRGRLDLVNLLKILRPKGRLIVIDWRKDPESWESGPPENLRFTKEEVASTLTRCFQSTYAENLGRSMFAVTATREISRG